MSKFKKLGSIAKLMGITSATAATTSFMSGPIGHRKDAATESAVIAAGATAAGFTAAALGKVVFRRFRGRIIPIRKK